MRSPYTQPYLHMVWATWDRLPLITGPVEGRLYEALVKKCRDLKCVPLAIGGMADHVHLLVRLPTTLTVADLAKLVKGSSSYLMTHQVMAGEFFKWQGTYGAFTLRKVDVPQVKAYIERQKAHRAAGTLRGEWEQVTIWGEDESPKGDLVRAS